MKKSLSASNTKIRTSPSGILGIKVKLLPAQYIRAYVKHNKTDAADAAALLEAARASDMRPVRAE